MPVGGMAQVAELGLCYSFAGSARMGTSFLGRRCGGWEDVETDWNVVCGGGKLCCKAARGVRGTHRFVLYGGGFLT